MADCWAWWRSALAGEVGPIHENVPESGFYRVKNDPVAIWYEGETAVATRAGRQVEDVCALWTFAAKWPISVEAYEAVAEREEPWPDAIDVPAGIGHNAPDPHSAIVDELGVLTASWAEWFESIGGAITTQEHSDKAATYAERASGLEGRAQDEFAAEKKPFLDGGRVVDKKWRDIKADTENTRKAIKTAIGVYQIAEDERRKALAAQVKAETGAEVEAAPVRTKGAARAVSLRTVKKAEITDLPALAAYLAGMKTPPEEWVDLTRRIAERMLLAGVEVPGAKINTSQAAA